MWHDLARIAAALMMCGVIGAARAERIADFMVMQVCTDADGAIVPRLAPIDADCTARRQLRAGEAPPYRLADWPRQSAACTPLLARTNVPVERNGITRVVSLSERVAEARCDATDETARGLSVQWHDAAFGFIMASWSPVAVSNFESPLCAGANGGARRFFRGWVISPAELPPAGTPGWAIFASHLAAGPPAGAADPCPQRYHEALTLWLVDAVQFRAARLTAVISHHYAAGSASGDAPGGAMQVERTYWTREFGLTRWEKWAREQWTNPHTGEAATRTAARLFAGGRCNAPYSLPASITPHMAAEPLTGDGAWRQVVRDPASGARAAWVMTLCEDYTNIIRTPASAAVQAAAARIDAAYWRPDQRAGGP
jgi:hypothetical protein